MILQVIMFIDPEKQEVVGSIALTKSPGVRRVLYRAHLRECARTGLSTSFPAGRESTVHGLE
jgi:hypothetical protein